MTEDPPVRSYIRSSYNWLHPDIDAAQAAVKTVILPFFVGDPVFSGSLKQEGAPEISQVHDSFESWKTSLGPAWDEFAVDVRAHNGSAHLEFLFTLRRVTLNIDTTDAHTTPLKDLVEAFQNSLRLGPPRRSTDQQNERVEGHYHAQIPNESGWFKELLHKLEAWAGGVEYFNGTITLTTAPQFRRSLFAYGDWKSESLTKWAEVAETHGNVQNKGRDFSVRYHANRAELFVLLSSYDSTEVRQLFEVLEREFPILPFGDVSGAKSRQGERRKYFTSETITPAWFEQASDLVESAGPAIVSFQGRFRTAGSGEESSRPRLSDWRDEVISKWDNVISVYCWITTTLTTLTVEIDLLRDLVTLDIQAPDDESIQQRLNEFELQLKLAPAGENPYQYRRFLREYKIKRWTTSEQYTEALKSSVEFAFPGRIPGVRVAMTLAYIAVGDTEEDLYPFTSYQAFLQRLASAEEFTRAELGLEGPGGRSLGVLLNRKKKRLIVRTSVERADLGRLTRPFENAMTISLEESKDEPDREKQEKPKFTWLMLATALLSILAALWSGGVAIFTSQRGLTAFRDQYVLEITHPVGDSGKQIEVAGQELRIEWRLTKKDLTGDHPDLQSDASVEVVPDANPRDARTYPGKGGSLVIPLLPGSHWVKVVSAVDHNSAAAVKVRVLEPQPEVPNNQPRSRRSATGNR